MANERILYINNDLRTILIPEEFVIGVVNDKLTHRVTFRLPRFYHGIDLSDNYNIFVKYTNALLEDDMSMIEHEETDVRETSIFFTWVPNRTAYMAEGPLRFNVSLVKVDDEGTVINEFNTAAHTLRVLPGIELDQLIPEEVEKNILAQSRNILEKADRRAEAAAVSEQNAKTSELNARQSEVNAAASEQAARESEDIAEAWAVGKRHGVPVPSTHETYNNNAKHWAEVSRIKTVFGERTVWDAMNYVYPIGAIYMSTSNVNPASIFGGTWERIKSKFLFACEDSGDYANGKTGGVTSVTLATSQIPSHNHTFTGNQNTTTSVGLTSNGPSTNSTGGTELTTEIAVKANDRNTFLTKTDENDIVYSGFPKDPTDPRQNFWETDLAGSCTITETIGATTQDHYSGLPVSKGGVPANNDGELSRCKYTSRSCNYNDKDDKNTCGHYHRLPRLKTIKVAKGITNTLDGYEVVTGYTNYYENDITGTNESYDAHMDSINSMKLSNHVHGMAHYHDIAHKHEVPSHKHNMRHVHSVQHTHDINHVHKINSHTHSLSNHTHSINAHSHKVTPTGSISNTGGGQAHTNMPPYICVYIWKRTGLAPIE